MSEWDAVSTVVSDATDDWDSVSTPVAPLPDPTPIQNSVQKNLSADSGESTTPANFTQNLDKGLGMPVSKMMGDGKDANQIQVPKDIRTNVVDSYKNGTASSFSDWMQSALPVAAQKVSNAGKAFYAGVGPDFAQGFYGTLETMSNISGNRMYGGKFFGGLAEQAKKEGERVQESIGEKGFLENQIYAAFRSIGSSLPGLAMSATTGNPAFALTAGGVTAGGIGAHQASEAGVNPVQSAVYGLSQGSIEAATEFLPVTRLLGDLHVGTGFFKTLLHQAITDVPGELAATTLQNLNEWAVINPDKPFSTYLNQLPEDLAKTAIVSLVSSGVQTTAIHAANKAANIDLKTLVAAKTGKPESAVTQNDIDMLASNAASKAGVPSHQEFADHALVMFGKEGEKDGTDLLHEIYKETGVKPDQVYTDMQSDPAIAAEIATGKIPQSYMAAMAQQPESVTSEEPQTPSGMVRLYHSGSVGEGDSGRWVSTSRRYAQDYRPDLPLFYIDIPENDARITPDYDDQGVKQGFTFNFELTPEESTQLKDIPRISNNGNAAPVSQPPPPSSPPPTPPSPRPEIIKEIIKSGGMPVYHDTSISGLESILNSGAINPMVSRNNISVGGNSSPSISVTRDFNNYSRYKDSPYRIIIDDTMVSHKSKPTSFTGDGYREEAEEIYGKPIGIKSVKSIAINMSNRFILQDIESGKLESIVRLARSKGINVSFYDDKSRDFMHKDENDKVRQAVLDSGIMDEESTSVSPPSPTDPVAMQNAILGKVPQATTVAPQGNETPKSIGRFFQSNWDDLIRKLFNNDVKAAAPFDFFENDRAEIAGSEHYSQEIQNIGKEIFGTKTNRATVNKLYADLKHNKLGKFINARSQEVDLRYSKAEARKFAMEIENPEILATYMSPEGNGYTQEMVDAILQTLDKQDLQYIEKQKQFYADYHERLNSVYSRMNGVDLPKVSEYSPIRREKEDISIDDDLLNPATFAPNVDPSAIQQRMKNNYPVAKVADTVAMSNYISQAEKYIAWAEKLRALNQTFNDQEVARRIKEKHGPDLLKQLQTHLETFGKDLSQSYNPAQKLINSVYSKFAVAKLAFKLALIPKQFSSFMTFAAEIPAKDTLAGWADFAMNPAKAIETLMTSPVLKNRYSSGNLSMEMKVIEKNNEEYKTILGKFLKHPSFAEAAMLPAKLGDMSAVMFGGWPVYKYYIKQGLSHEEALKKVERITQDTQQSSRPYQLSLAQKNPYARLSLMFASAPIALVRAEIRAIQDVRAGNITTAQFTRKMMIYHIFIPLLYEFIASGGEDWEDNKADYERAMLLGPFAGVAIIGNLVNALTGMAMGTKDSKYGLQAPGFAGTIYGTLKKLNSDITKAKTDVKYGGIDDLEDILTVLYDFKNTAIDASSFAGVPEYFIKNLPLAVEQARDEEYKAAGMLAAGYPPTDSIAPDKYEKKQKITNRERQKSLKSEARSEGRIIKRD
jgi:hypothetical protein